jgi:hypothetical protein
VLNALNYLNSNDKQISEMVACMKNGLLTMVRPHVYELAVLRLLVVLKRIPYTTASVECAFLINMEIQLYSRSTQSTDVNGSSELHRRLSIS